MPPPLLPYATLNWNAREVPIVQRSAVAAGSGIHMDAPPPLLVSFGSQTGNAQVRCCACGRFAGSKTRPLLLPVPV